MKSAIYPGTFDPITFGHLDLLKRACCIFDKVYIAVAKNAGKNPMFSAYEREQLIGEIVAEMKLDNAEVKSFDSLTVEFAKSLGASAIIRGLRAVSDFEYEFQMAQMNRHLSSEIETIFLMPSEKFFYTSSTLIKQVQHYGGNIDRFVPKNVLNALREQRQK